MIFFYFLSFFFFLFLPFILSFFLFFSLLYSISLTFFLSFLRGRRPVEVHVLRPSAELESNKLAKAKVCENKNGLHPATRPFFHLLANPCNIFQSKKGRFSIIFQQWHVLYTIFTASYTKYLQDHRSHKLPINRHCMSPFKHIVPRSPAFGCQPALTPNQHLGKVFCHFSPKFVKKRCECAKKDNFYH